MNLKSIIAEPGKGKPISAFFAPCVRARVPALLFFKTPVTIRRCSWCSSFIGFKSGDKNIPRVLDHDIFQLLSLKVLKLEHNPTNPAGVNITDGMCRKCYREFNRGPLIHVPGFFERVKLAIRLLFQR